MIIEAGGRNLLIQRLHHYGMAETEIKDVTGASVDRIKGVVARGSRESATNSTPA